MIVIACPDQGQVMIQKLWGLAKRELQLLHVLIRGQVMIQKLWG